MDFELTPAATAALDEHFARAREKSHAPGLAYGVVYRGALLHARGFGTLRGGEDHRPDADSVFRIASMTKSFTAAALLLLRDEGRLRLDDPVATYVPELTSLAGPTADSPPITLRHLLTMSSGIAEDDPWGDRHLDAGRDQMDAWFREGATFAHAPGTTYEYSNYGYAMLGRVLSNVGGMPAQELISERLLAPLGMATTRWVAPGGDNVAAGHRWESDAIAPEPALGDGGFAPMGGLWSSLADLARWVGFFCDAYPPRDGTDDLPLRRSTRREMQQQHRAWPPSVRLNGARLDVLTGGYGMGLTSLQLSRLGLMVSHSGGLPGFGSNMRWWPERHLGIVAMANVTYANMEAATDEAAHLLADHMTLPPTSRVAAPSVTAYGRRLGELVAGWDDALAEAMLADNVLLDRSADLRAADAATLIEHHGPLAVDAVEPASRAGGVTKLRGERGEVRLRFDLSSNVPPTIQRYTATSALDATPALEQAAHQVLAGDAPDVVVARALVGEHTRLDTMDHDGGPAATFEVTAERGRFAITVTLDAAGQLASYELAFKDQPFE